MKKILYNTQRDDDGNIIVHKVLIAKVIRPFVVEKNGKRFGKTQVECAIDGIARKGQLYPSNLLRVDDDDSKRRRKKELRLCFDAANLVLEEMATVREGQGCSRKYTIPSDKIDSALDALKGLYDKESHDFIMVETKTRIRETKKRIHKGITFTRAGSAKTYAYKPHLQALVHAARMVSRAAWKLQSSNGHDYDDIEATRSIAHKHLSEVARILEGGDQ